MKNMLLKSTFLLVLISNVSLYGMEQGSVEEKGLEEKSAFEQLPNELKIAILQYLTHAKGRTENVRLINAANNIVQLREVSKTFRDFLDDEQSAGFIISELANRYSEGNKAKAAIALASPGAGKWLASYSNTDEGMGWIGLEALDAVRNNQIGIVNFLMTYIPGIVNLVSPLSDNTALHIAAVYGFFEIVQKILTSPYFDADLINHENNEQDTILIIAARNGNVKIVEKLLAVPGIGVNITDRTGATALIMAALNGHTDVVEKLLARPGIDINMHALDGITALHVAASNGHGEIVKKLLQHPDIDVNTTDSQGISPLMYASISGNTAIVDQLLKIPNLKINAQDSDGRTALMAASGHGNQKIMERLLMAGADVLMFDNDGENALLHAQKSNSPNKDAIIKILIEYVIKKLKLK